MSNFSIINLIDVNLRVSSEQFNNTPLLMNVYPLVYISQDSILSTYLIIFSFNIYLYILFILMIALN